MKIHDLQLGGPQTAILAAFAVIALLLATLFAAIALASRGDVEFARVQKIGYWIRARWLILLVTLLVVQLAVAFSHLPYTRAGTPDALVRVDGYQFNWSMDKSRIPAGATVRFAVTSADVNHGFGVYDPDGELIGSVQAMPGYVNKLDLKLTKPGRYLVACLEFCGIGHHKMMRNFDVVKTGG